MIEMKKRNAFRCPKCGSTVFEGDHFCSACGNEFFKEDWSTEKVELMKQRMVLDYDQKEKKRGGVFIVLAVIAALVLLFAMDLYYPTEEKKLEAIVTKVQELILQEDYETAMVEVQAIRVKKEGLFDSNYDHWENQRKDLIKLIEQKQKEKK